MSIRDVHIGILTAVFFRHRVFSFQTGMSDCFFSGQKKAAIYCNNKTPYGFYTINRKIIIS